MHHLVQFGLNRYLGHIASDHPLPRGSSVVITTPRGSEIAQIIDELSADSALVRQEPPNSLLRTATVADLEAHTAATAKARQILEKCENLVAAHDLPVMVIDCELLLSHDVAYIQVLHWQETNLDSVVLELAEEFQMRVFVEDHTRKQTAPQESGCTTCGSSKSGGCSSCGSGCSTGSCSKGKVASAEELTSYFANLRQEMEKNARIALN
ncbi:MAG: hypothetical protein R3B84_14680 [Zavarzinella sp.]